MFARKQPAEPSLDQLHDEFLTHNTAIGLIKFRIPAFVFYTALLTYYIYALTNYSHDSSGLNLSLERAFEVSCIIALVCVTLHLAIKGDNIHITKGRRLLKRLIDSEKFRWEVGYVTKDCIFFSIQEHKAIYDVAGRYFFYIRDGISSPRFLQIEELMRSLYEDDRKQLEEMITKL